MCTTDCVLVDLDWAEPMMLFILHVTCSCIPMHMFFPFNIFFDIFWTVLELFWLSSLSLPLSVYVSLLLWHPNINLLHLGTLFIPGHPLCWQYSFLCPVPWWEGQIELLWELFSMRHSFWTPSHLVELLWHQLPTVIYNKGWGPLCNAPITYPSVLIQEFYSNMHGFDYSVPHFITSIVVTQIVVTP